MIRSALLPITLVMLLLLGCGGGDPADSKDTSSIGSEVQNASQQQIANVNGMLQDGIRVSEAYAVKSDHHERAYWVSTVLSGDQMSDNPVAVWLLTGPANQPGLTLAVSRYAEEFTVGNSVRDT
jgi:hypothetical protein